MKVKMLVGRAGTDENGRPMSQNAGDVVEVGSEEAKRMLAAGQCEPVKSSAAKKATKPKGETTSVD